MKNNSISTVNRRTQARYDWYAKYYPVISLLAYWIVWRGRIFKHVHFFADAYKEAANNGGELLDIATGDGSLTQIAYKTSKMKLVKLICLDLSPEMLRHAKEKIKNQNTQFIIGDVMNLPFPQQSQLNITCFGGLNSFPSGQLALKEIARVLHPKGHIRGSLLLLPKAKWRQNLIQKWIHEGYQTEVITPVIFETWLASANLKLKRSQRHGDVLLFELEHRRN